MPPAIPAILIRRILLRPSARAVHVTDLPAAVNRQPVHAWVAVETQKVTVANDANPVTTATRPLATPMLAVPALVLYRHTATRK